MNDENTKGGFHLKKNEYFEKYGFWPPDNDGKKINIDLTDDEIKIILYYLDCDYSIRNEIIINENRDEFVDILAEKLLNLLEKK